MNLPDWLNKEDIDKLRRKVLQQKQEWVEHVREKREVKRWHLAKLLAKPEQWRIKVHKVWKNLNLRKALFLWDEEDVQIVQESGALWQRVSDFWNKVTKFDYVDMDMRVDKEQVITDDGMFGLWVVMIDGYDDVEHQPIKTVVNPLVCYWDPRAWNTSKMAYFGTDVFKNKYELEEWPYFNIDKLCNEYSQELEDFERARNEANRTQYITSEVMNEFKKNDRFAVTNHITSYDGRLFLTTWSASVTTCIRIIELRDLTSKERRRPDKIDLWVTLYRAKPIPYSFFWASLFDEVEQYQDLATILMYLQVEQAKRSGLWPNKYVNSNLWLDLDDIQNKPLSWGVFEYTPDMSDPNVTAQNGIFVEPNEPVSQFPAQVLQMNDSLMDETLGYSSQQVFGISQWGSQTKAEVQTLQQNINEQLRLIADNYLESSKQYWKDHFSCYASNMSATDRKKITLFDLWRQDSYTLKKADFVPNGKIQIYITSKVQQDIRDKQDFPIVQVIYGQIIQNIPKESARYNEITRTLIDKWWVDGLRWLDLFPYNKDERKSITLNEAINLDLYKKDIYWPKEWEDYQYIIDKLEYCIDNNSKLKAMVDYELFRDNMAELETPAPQGMAQWNAQSTSMWANMLASQSESTPSLSWVASWV